MPQHHIDLNEDMLFFFDAKYIIGSFLSYHTSSDETEIHKSVCFTCPL